MKFQSSRQIQIILDSIADGLFTVDRHFRVTSFNRAAERITGISSEQAVGKPCRFVFQAEICSSNCILRHSIKTGEPVVNREITITDAKGSRIPVSISTAILKDEKGFVIGGVETFRDLTAEKAIQAELKNRHTFFDIIGKNSKMRRIFELLETVSETEATVLLQGESGTGKGLFAQAIHKQSPRAQSPFVIVDCGSIPQNLLESELFGYKAGAFTDARADKPGRLAVAKGGTLFLDEIGNMPLSLQSKLLRLLQDRVYEPLGCLKPEKADLRVVVATNQPLEKMVADGRFRQDLYYRIKVVKVVIPPLRERREDIPLLARHFIKKHAAINGRSVTGIEPEAAALLMKHDWPGNVRELENMMEYAVVVCGSSRIAPENLPEDLTAASLRYKDSTCESNKIPAARYASEMEKIYISDMLKRNGFNRKAAAAEMGVHPSTLWRKMKRLNMPLPDRDGRGKRGGN